MLRNKNSPVRLNIYIHDPGIRRQIKAVAARKDVSVSEYCLQAIANQLVKEQEMSLEREVNPLKTAVKKAQKFRDKIFGGKVFAVSSADLIRAARKGRNIS